MSRYQEALLGQVIAQLKRDEIDALRCDTHEIFYMSDCGCPGCAERERIIKLIENERVEPSPNNAMANYDRLVIEGVKEQLILLIKGENK